MTEVADSLRRVRLVSISLSTEVMGTEHSLLNLAPHLAEHGVDVALAAPGGGELQERWTRLGLEFAPMDLPARVGLRTVDGGSWNPAPDLLGQIPRSLSALRTLVGSIREYDVVHSNSLLAHPDCAAAGVLARRPVILELHDVVPAGMGQAALNLAVLTARRSIAVSATVRDQLSPRAQSKTEVIAQGVDVDRFVPGHVSPGVRARLTSTPSAPLVAVVGRVDPAKGVHLLLEGVAALRDSGSNLHVVVVGAPGTDDGAYVAELRQFADQRLGNSCRFIEPVTEVPELLRSVDVLAVPSVLEPFGLVALEAQACGIPVIASNSGGLREFIRDGVNGLLVAPGDSGALAAGIRRLLDSPELGRSLTSAAVSEAGARRSIGVRAERFASLIREQADRSIRGKAC